jgi:hypothetical protein
MALSPHTGTMSDSDDTSRQDDLTAQQQQQSIFPFLTLPRELRDMIYFSCLPVRFHRPMVFIRSDKDIFWLDCKPHNIGWTCKQVQEEYMEFTITHTPPIILVMAHHNLPPILQITPSPFLGHIIGAVRMALVCDQDWRKGRTSHTSPLETDDTAIRRVVTAHMRSRWPQTQENAFEAPRRFCCKAVVPLRYARV